MECIFILIDRGSVKRINILEAINEYNNFSYDYYSENPQSGVYDEHLGKENIENMEIGSVLDISSGFNIGEKLICKVKI